MVASYIGNTTTTNATDTLLIKNFQICCTIYDIYAIKIEWNNINFDQYDDYNLKYAYKYEDGCTNKREVHDH